MRQIQLWIRRHIPHRLYLAKQYLRIGERAKRIVSTSAANV